MASTWPTWHDTGGTHLRGHQIPPSWPSSIWRFSSDRTHERVVARGLKQSRRILVGFLHPAGSRPLHVHLAFGRCLLSDYRSSVPGTWNPRASAAVGPASICLGGFPESDNVFLLVGLLIHMVPDHGHTNTSCIDVLLLPIDFALAGRGHISPLVHLTAGLAVWPMPPIP